MSELEQGNIVELSDSSVEQPVVIVATEEVISSTALTAARASEQVMALDDQAPRSWDLHKSGW